MDCAQDLNTFSLHSEYRSNLLWPLNSSFSWQKLHLNINVCLMQNTLIMQTGMLKECCLIMRASFKAKSHVAPTVSLLHNTSIWNCGKLLLYSKCRADCHHLMVWGVAETFWIKRSPKMTFPRHCIIMAPFGSWGTPVPCHPLWKLLLHGGCCMLLCHLNPNPYCHCCLILLRKWNKTGVAITVRDVYFLYHGTALNIHVCSYICKTLFLVALWINWCHPIRQTCRYVWWKSQKYVDCKLKLAIDTVIQYTYCYCWRRTFLSNFIFQTCL